MGGEAGRAYSLPLLPAGISLFEGLPARAIVLDALAPAVGSGVIILIQGGRAGVLVVRSGAIADAVCFDDGSRIHGNEALRLIRDWESATMSASRWTDAAMSLLDPLIHGDMCYDDLRLEWTAWPQLLDDLRRRGRTFVVEVSTPDGRGVTVVRDGQQIAAYAESHPSLTDPQVIDHLAERGTGSVRILMAQDGEPARVTPPSSLQATPAAPSPTDPAERLGLAPNRDDANATLSALFGAHLASARLAPLIVLDASPVEAEVDALRPELKLMVQRRLQRSSRPVEDIVDTAADDRRSLVWLADQVRLTRLRGFVASTFDQLADDMLALARKP